MGYHHTCEPMDVEQICKLWGFAVHVGTHLAPLLWLHSNRNAVLRSGLRLLSRIKDTKGIEPYYSFYSSSADLAGSGSVNSFTGNLCFMHSSLSTTDEILPYTVSLAYNSCLYDQYYTSAGHVITPMTSSLSWQGLLRRPMMRQSSTSNWITAMNTMYGQTQTVPSITSSLCSFTWVNADTGLLR